MKQWVKDASALADQINERRLKEGLAEPINAVELLEASRRERDAAQRHEVRIYGMSCDRESWQNPDPEIHR